MNVTKRTIRLLSVAILLLIGVCIFLAFRLQEKPQQIEYEDYRETTDKLFQTLSNQFQAAEETTIVTGIIGIPWADGTDDVVDGNWAQPAKRFLQVCFDDADISAYVVSYFAPDITQSGYGGIFRQHPSDNSMLCFSSTTSYACGIIVTSFVFGNADENLDMNAVVEKDFALTAQIQNFLTTAE